MAEDRGYRVGRMTEAVDMMKPTVSVSSTGARQVTYVKSVTCYSEVTEHDYSSERIDNNLSSTKNLSFNAETIAALDTNWKVSYGGETYDIEEVKKLGNGIYSSYRCVKRMCDEED